MPWNECTFIFPFIDGLNGHIQREIGSNDVPSSLQEAIALAVRFDNLVTIRPRQQEPEHPLLVTVIKLFVRMDG